MRRLRGLYGYATGAPSPSGHGTRRAFVLAMTKLLLPLCGLVFVAAACNPGEKNTEKTVTDTAVTPVHQNDTTVVQKKVEVSTDTLKKTHKKP